MNTSVPSGNFPIVFKRQHSSAPAKGRHSILDAEAYAPMIYLLRASLIVMCWHYA